MTATPTILKIDASARKAGSMTRELTDTLVTRLLDTHPSARVLTRDVSAGLPVVDEAWVGANFTDPAERSSEQKLKLALSDTLVAELKAADVLVIAAPVYNFGIPASLKAWVDLVARARETFRYTENGPEGLLKGKKAYVVVASGGVPVNSPVDFATPYLKQVLAFIGITDVTVIAADQLMMDGDAKRAAARAAIEAAVTQAA
ncbi:FMN-dependent NADH-azoreductase [Pannonibacter sp. SL95]|jgi:FMN-dependent NADH-azoreductase|uniref:FMN-dependent NADH-azoreductase n=1 Tax=Pannonibacter sp. SL95 TaxID=2995153 RepID=UPI002276588D|nr:NAD(P)H-dependent oxidoreductase [Pannonibacter sp. SL95]MCY1705544.1 NAD(P)H-dependent oxidoreductase [Pannonibacter sp. SL95]